MGMSQKRDKQQRGEKCKDSRSKASFEEITRHYQNARRNSCVGGHRRLSWLALSCKLLRGKALLPASLRARRYQSAIAFLPCKGWVTLHKIHLGIIAYTRSMRFVKWRVRLQIAGDERAILRKDITAQKSDTIGQVELTFTCRRTGNWITPKFVRFFVWSHISISSRL